MLRRDFVQLTAGAVVASSLPGCASLVATAVTPMNGEIWLAIRNFSQLDQPGGYLRIRPEGAQTTLYVLALEGGGFSVVSPICTHLQCTVAVEGALLLCPCHGSTFDREGRVLQGPAMQPLQRFPCTVTPDGQLVIRYGAQS